MINAIKWSVLLVFILTHPGHGVLAASLGDPAPGLKVAQWVKGAPIDLKKQLGKTIFVIEFWETGCPYCVESIPLLNALQQRFGKQDVAVVGVTDEDIEVVKEFVLQHKDIQYRIAVDDQSQTNKSYLESYGIESVPHAFVIDRKGRMVWEGHPRDGLEEVVGRLVEGRFDLQHHLRLSKAKALMPPYFYLASKTDEDAITRALGASIFQHARNHPDLLHELARQIISGQRIRRPDLSLALRAVVRAVKLTGGTAPILETHALVLERMGRKEDASAVRTRIAKLQK